MIKDENGVYRDLGGKEIAGVNLDKYTTSEKYDFSNMLSETDAYNKLGEQKNFNSIAEVEALVNKAFDGTAGTKDVPALQKAVQDLRYRIINAKNITEREKATSLYLKLLNQDPNAGLVINDKLNKKILEFDPNKEIETPNQTYWRDLL